MVFNVLLVEMQEDFCCKNNRIIMQNKDGIKSENGL